ncbi:tetratricopeptide repeat protein [bacterium]|nr:tetratricopeptide repeat protein [bacterium]
MQRNTRKTKENEVSRLLLQGEIALMNQLSPQARKYFKKAVKLNPASPEALFSLGEFFRFLGKWHIADKLYRRAIELSPRSFYKYRLALLLKDMGKFASASQLLEEVLQENPNDAFYHFLLGEIFLEMDEYEKTIKHWKIAVELTPLDDFYHAWLGIALAIVGDWKNAESELAKACKLKPTNSVYFCLLGDIQWLIGDQHMADFYYEKANGMSPYDEFNLRKFRKTLFKRVAFRDL